jgi:HEAT repeat protein
LQGQQAASLIEPLLQETAPAVRAEVAAALLPFNPASADQVLREAMNSPDPGVRSAVAKHLGQAGNHAIPYLLDLLHDQTPRPRISAIRALGHVGTVKHVAVLRPILNDPDVAVRVTAAGAIGRLLIGGS